MTSRCSRVEHQQALRHVVERGVEAHVLRLQLGLALAQLGGAFLDQPLQPAIELVELLDHQRDRAVGAPPVAVGLLVGRADQLAERVEIDLARRLVAFASCLGEQLVHGLRPLRVIGVTVMVWLCSSHRPDAACGEISPYE